MLSYTPRDPSQRIADVRRQNGHFNRSTSNMEGLGKTIVKDKKLKKRPIKEVATRWNSTLYALGRYYSTAPFHRAYHTEKHKLLKTAAARRSAKNPVTLELCKIVGQVVTIGSRVLACTLRCEGNQVTLLEGGIDVVLLYEQIANQKSFIMPTSPDASLAEGQVDIAKYREANPSAKTVEIDGVLFQGLELMYEVCHCPVQRELSTY